MLRYLRRPRPASGTQPALFVDRDGVLNRRVVGGYVTSPEALVPLGGVVPALVAARAAGAVVVVVSNQGCIARGLASEADVLRVHAALLESLEGQGAIVDALYVCPHHPLAPRPADRRCSCRKPAPGLLLAAAADLTIDLGSSVLVGDQDSDAAAARAAGLAAARIRLVQPEDMSAAESAALAADVTGLIGTRSGTGSTTGTGRSVAREPGT